MNTAGLANQLEELFLRVNLLVSKSQIRIEGHLSRTLVQSPPRKLYSLPFSVIPTVDRPSIPVFGLLYSEKSASRDERDKSLRLLFLAELHHHIKTEGRSKALGKSIRATNSISARRRKTLSPNLTRPPLSDLILRPQALRKANSGMRNPGNASSPSSFSPPSYFAAMPIKWRLSVSISWSCLRAQPSTGTPRQ